MGRKGADRHMKRQVSPVSWPIPRKGYVWAVRPSPGPHGTAESLPLGVVLRDMLGYADNLREAEVILNAGRVKVDGKTRQDEGFPVGIMDVIELVDAKQYFRLLPSRKRPILHAISRDESTFKLCRIESKTTVAGGHVQYNLHDGRNLLVRISDPLRPQGNTYNRCDTLRITVPELTVLDHLRFSEGLMALVTGGGSSGRYGKIESIQKRGNFPDTVSLISPEKTEIRTIVDYVFPIGVDSALISLPKGV